MEPHPFVVISVQIVIFSSRLRVLKPRPFVLKNFTSCLWFIGGTRKRLASFQSTSTWSAVKKMGMAQISQREETGKSGPLVRRSLEDEYEYNYEDKDLDYETETDLGKDEPALWIIFLFR